MNTIIADTNWAESEYNRTSGLYTDHSILLTASVVEELDDVWQDCADKKISVVRASATTTAAITAIQRAETELLDAFEMKQPHADSYMELVRELTTESTIANGILPLGRGRGPRGYEISPFDAFLFFPVARTLLNFSENGAIHKDSRKIRWPMKVPPLTFDYVHGEWSLKETAEHQKLQEDDTLLTKIPFDLQFPDDSQD